jgi:hypothetical protein
MALISVVFMRSFVQAQEQPQQQQSIGYLLVQEPFAKVYEQLDPMSPLIRQAKKGEYLEVVYNGESWNKVKIDGKIGWVEKKAGKIVAQPGGVSIGGIILLILVIFGSFGMVIYFIKKNQSPSASGVDEDI